MTLQQAIEWLGQHPGLAIFYLFAPFLTAVLAGILGKGEGHLSPWKYLYAIIVYAGCIPGVFAFALNIYLFLFERISIFSFDIYTQILPIISMFATIFVVRRNVDLRAVPGFNNLSGLVTIISAALCFMWFLDRTHIMIFSYMPFWQLGLILLGLVVLIRYGWSRLVR